MNLTGITNFNTSPNRNGNPDETQVRVSQCILVELLIYGWCLIRDFDSRLIRFWPGLRFGLKNILTVVRSSNQLASLGLKEISSKIIHSEIP